MSKTFIGDACADCGPKPGGGRRYVKVGVAFKDNTYGTISIKIDALPLPQDTWRGWINVFDRGDGENKPGNPRPNAPVYEEDVPF